MIIVTDEPKYLKTGRSQCHLVIALSRDVLGLPLTPQYAATL